MVRRATDISPELDNYEQEELAEGRSLEPLDIRRMPPLTLPAREIELSLARLDPHLVAIHELDPRAVAEYNRLAITLISGAARSSLKRVLITSAHHGEGRTCVTLNLAAALANTKQRVLVIDTHLQRPSVSRLLGIDSEVGLAEAVANNVPPEEAVTRLLPADFFVLPTRGQIENSAELLASPVFGRLIEALESKYDFILFDSAPLLTSADASLILLHTDATLLVVRPSTTSAREMGRAISLLKQELLFGVVVNRTSG
jgi:polysaccharide biosynthesis transport protein